MKKLPVLVVMLFFVSPLLMAQTTGSIVGRVTDDQGGALPGVIAYSWAEDAVSGGWQTRFSSSE